MTELPFRRIAVEGPIGVGKTTLARRLAGRLSFELSLERVAENPFLECFYEDPGAFALQTQLFFLFDRFRQLSGLPAEGGVVADYTFSKDRLFAALNLAPGEMELYARVEGALRPLLPAPEVIIRLRAPVEVLLARVRERARPFEAKIDSAYLDRVSRAYDAFFSDWRECPVVVVETGATDLREDTGPLDELLAEMSAAAPAPREAGRA